MGSQQVEKIPHSVELINFPPTVWPHDGKQAVDKEGRRIVHPAVKWLVLSRKTELMRCGALVRPNRVLVLLMPQYLSWLQRQAERVANFQITPNVNREKRKA